MLRLERAAEYARTFIIDIAFGGLKNKYTILPEVLRAIIPPFVVGDRSRLGKLCMEQRFPSAKSSPPLLVIYNCFSVVNSARDLFRGV